MPIILIENPIEKSELSQLIKEQFHLVKAVVDIKRNVMAIGAELHSDGESLLLEQGSHQRDLWGINLYPKNSHAEFIEFDSMINLRPSCGNYSRGIDDPCIQQKIKEIVNQLVRE